MGTVLIALLSAGVVLVAYNTVWKWGVPKLVCRIEGHEPGQTHDTFFDLPVYRCGTCGRHWVYVRRSYTHGWEDRDAKLYLDPIHRTTDRYKLGKT